jgi:hypothetical protein
MRAIGIVLLATVMGLSGCRDDVTGPRDPYPPAAPRGLRTVTGDHTVYMSWLENTEPDVAGYRIYMAPCATGSGCPYERIGSTGGTSFTVDALTNGVTRYFAVAAYDFAGNESDLTYETIFDTPRPEGFGARVASAAVSPSQSGWDFSTAHVRPWDDPATDAYYTHSGSTLLMVGVDDVDAQTDIQDAGYATSLDAVDFAPNGGWSPTGTAELIQGHCYVVWTRDNHFAKFRVTSLIAQSSGPPVVEFDWAYQVDPGNPELKARPVRQPGAFRTPAAAQP